MSPALDEQPTFDLQHVLEYMGKLENGRSALPPIDGSLQCLDPADRRWVHDTLNRGLEISLHQARGFTAGPSISSDYRTIRKCSKSVKIQDSPYFGDLLRVLDAQRYIPPQLMRRIAYLLLAHWESFIMEAMRANKYKLDEFQDAIRDHPEYANYMMTCSPFEKAHGLIFGPNSVFQTITKDFGPLATALLCHRGRRHILHQESSATRFPPARHSPFIGPYPNPLKPQSLDKDRKRTCQLPRQFRAWLASDSLPKYFWFTGCEPHDLRLVFSGTLSKHLNIDPHFNDVPEPPTNKTYRWSKVVVLEDYLIYRYARTFVLIIQALRNVTGHGQSSGRESEDPVAEVTMRKLIAIVPPVGHLLQCPPDEPPTGVTGSVVKTANNQPVKETT